MVEKGNSREEYFKSRVKCFKKERTEQLLKEKAEWLTKRHEEIEGRRMSVIFSVLLVTVLWAYAHISLYKCMCGLLCVTWLSKAVRKTLNLHS